MPQSDRGVWFGDALRKVRILDVSAAWARDRGAAFDAESYAARLAEAGVETVQFCAKDPHGICYYPSPEGEVCPIDILGPMTEAAHGHGLRLIASFSVALDHAAAGLHPEWCFADAHGQPRDCGPFRWLCLGSDYRSYACRQLEALAQHAPVDGVRLDGVPTTWGGFDRIGWRGRIRQPCTCIACRGAFRREFGREVPRDPDFAQTLECYRTLVATARSFLEGACAAIHRHRPEALVVYNDSGFPHDAVDNADLVSMEGHAPDYLRQSLQARWIKARGRPGEVLTPGALSGWDGWDQKPGALLTLETAIGAAHGASVTLGHRPIPAAAPNPGEFDALAEVFGRLRALEPLCVRPRGISDVGLALGIAALDAPHLGVPHAEEVEGWHGALLDAHIQYDLLPDLERLDDYAVLILGDRRSLAAAEVERILAFVEAGGDGVVTGLTGTADERGEPGLHSALWEAMGLAFVGESEDGFGYLRITDRQVGAGCPEVPILIERPPILVRATDAAVLAVTELPETGHAPGTGILRGKPPPDPKRTSPAICRRAHGAGSFTYAAWRLGAVIASGHLMGTWPKRLAQTLVAAQITEPVLRTDAPPGVEIVANETGDDIVLHLINHNAGRPEALAVAPGDQVQRDITITLGPRIAGQVIRCRSMPEDAPVRMRRVGRYAELILPPLAIHRVIVCQRRRPPTRTRPSGTGGSREV